MASGVPGIPKLADLEYRVVRSLGTGAGSSIFLIRDVPTGRRFALKVVKRQSSDDDVYVEQVQHEFEVGQRLHHRCVVKVYDCRIRRSWLKVAGIELLEEFVDGRNLDQIEHKHDIGQLTLIFDQIAAGLMHMHRKGVFHGDVKPSNIMLSRTAQVKILDFGTSWIKGQDKRRVQGTPQYMAPEQARDKIVDERTDLYNFGATMYRMLTGDYANLGLPDTEMVSFSFKKLRPPHLLNPAIPGTLSEAVMSCLQPNPDKRPAGVFEVRHQILAAARYLGLTQADLHGSEGPELPDEFDAEPADDHPLPGD